MNWVAYRSGVGGGGRQPAMQSAFPPSDSASQLLK